MNSVLFIMSTLINKKLYAHTLYDTECLFYEMITSHFAKNYNLQLSWVHNETDAQLIIFKYKKNTMKRKEKLHTNARR